MKLVKELQMLFCSLENVPESEVPRPLEPGCTRALMLPCSAAPPLLCLLPSAVRTQCVWRSEGRTPGYGVRVRTRGSAVPASPARLEGKGCEGKGKGLSLLCGGSPGTVTAHGQLPAAGSPSPQPAGPGSGSGSAPEAQPAAEEPGWSLARGQHAVTH